MNTNILIGQLLRVTAAALASLLAVAAQAAVPGIIGPTYGLRAEAAYITQPDGQTIYSWGYGCNNSPSDFRPAGMSGATCPTMQVPAPTLIVTEGQTVQVTLTNGLPAAAGNTSILFPGFKVTASGGVPGILTNEAPIGGTVTYTFVADTPGTHAYYSGTQGDLQIEMGLYGAIVVLPAHVPANCTPAGGTLNDQARAANGETDFRLAAAAYDHPSSCYDREYLFQFSEIDPRIHQQAADQAGVACAQPNGCMVVETEPYHPVYFMINGRSMPDNMDPIYSYQYQHQPYNGNPHMHPGDLTLLRVIGQGRWQHPFHEHGNHVRVLARDGNLLLARDPANPAQPDPQQRLAGPLLFTTTTTPGLAMDGIFYWTGKGLNWDVYAHTADTSVPGAQAPCIPDANGYYTSNPAAPNYYEWCGDHNKALESKPFGQVASGGPATLPDPTIVANGNWYSGTAYLGPDALARAVGPTPIPPSGTIANDPGSEAGFAYMWHSHNEREITTNNIFPGGMMMMMLVDPRAFVIDESK
jgi:FtsP/CotA-like multicopper oxidase with cupredoxin domain